MINSKKTAVSVLAAVLIIAGTLIYLKYFSVTRIALINFRDFQYYAFLQADSSPFVKIDRVDLSDEKITGLNRYSAIYLFGMGLHLNGIQTESLNRAIEKGRAVYTHASTSSQGDFNTLSEEDLKYIEDYFRNGGKRNLENLLNYTRRVIDGKKLFTEEVKEPFTLPDNVFFHKGDETWFETYEEYQKYYTEMNLYNPAGHNIAIVTTNIGPRNPNRNHIDMLINSLESKGFNVYPISGFEKRLSFLKEIDPSFVILFAHGRFIPGNADVSIEWLSDNNIPLISPLTILEPYDEWMKDLRGISGGMLSQSIVVPELDGAVYPYVLGAQFKNNLGLHILEGIPHRVERFSSLLKKWADLKTKPNSEKKIAIYYYKGPGLNSMVAGGMEVAPSLLNMLRRLKEEGYETGKLPADETELMDRINTEGPVLGAYAKGSIGEFLRNGNPELISVEDYLKWIGKYLAPEMYDDVVRVYGEPPGEYMSMNRDGKDYIAVAGIRFGNVKILPQPLPAYGEDEYQIIHGANQAPPHPYIASYMWVREEFDADAVLHFGTHGSLEFTPWKQAALSDYDWPDALIGGLPHYYVYIINNIGEAIIAKRRSYAQLISHITPPFSEAGLYVELSTLHDRLHWYYTAEDELLKEEYRNSIRRDALVLGINKDLGLNDFEEIELTDDIINKIHDYIHILEEEKITLGLYTLGVPYDEKSALETARLMAIDPLSHSMARLDVLEGRINASKMEDAHYFNEIYRERAGFIIQSILQNNASPDEFMTYEIKEEIPEDENEREKAHLVNTYRETLYSITDYYEGVKNSSDYELASIINALNGGYILPSSGGDPVSNPRSVPTGKNLYSIDAEQTPTPEAWNVGKDLAEKLIAAQIRNTGNFPEKIAFTLWGGEFIRAQGITLAQIFYLLGVEPVRNSRGVVHDVRLIPIEKLNRPRVDVVVQTSGQFRDIAASRIYLIDRAVRLASEASDEGMFINHVREGSMAAERVMREKGFSPLDARQLSTARVFGGVNGNYGTGIMGLVESGDKWEDDREITDQYLQNMGAVYTEGNWGQFRKGLFEAALQNTQAVVQPRSSNTWGPLSLDHVYEFMGGLSAVVRNVTGEDPEAYFNDLRNTHNPGVQGIREAVWVETRSTLFNPKYIEALQEGGASSANVFADTFRNTYGWNVMKPDAIDQEIWEGLYDIYIKDSYNLGLENFFREKNPYALQEMTAVMLETIRKGYWTADDTVISTIADLHARLVADHNAGCSGFVCDNEKLREMIADSIDPDLRDTYQSELTDARIGETVEQVQGMKLEKENLTLDRVMEIVQENFAAIMVMLLIIGVFSLAVIYGGYKQRAG